MPLGSDTDLERTQRDLIRKGVKFDREVKEDGKGREWYRITIPGMKPLLFQPDGKLRQAAQK